MEHEARTVAVTLDAVCVARGGRWVLDELSATIPAGRLTAIVGANGSGKSTLLDVLAGLRTPTHGTATHEGHAHRDGRPDVAYVPQHTPESASLPLTVRDVVAMGRWADRGPWRPLRRSDRELVARWIEELDLAGLAGRRLDTLSGGQRQRALVARALAQRSTLLVLDEPTTGLDTESRNRLVRALSRATAEGVSVVASTHDQRVTEVADVVLGLHEGRIRGERTPLDDAVAPDLATRTG